MMRLFIQITFILLASVSQLQAQTVGVLIAKIDTYKTALLKGITDHAATIDGLKLSQAVINAEREEQLAAVQELAKSKVDAIIVALSDGDMGPSITKIAKEANIPLVFVNNVPSNLDVLPDNQRLVASDEKQSGTMQAAEVCRRLGGKGNVVVLIGELVHAGARTRTTDIDKQFATAACKDMNIVERQSAYWQVDLANEQVTEWLNAGVRFDAVIANNDDMALGAIQAVKNSNLMSTPIIFAGIDATPAALEAMKAGDLQVTVLQNAAAQGSTAVDMALKLIRGEKLEREIYVPFELVTPENLTQYLP